MGKVIRIDHPLVQHKLSMLRDKNTDTKSFRELVGELAMLMAYEVTRDFPLKEVEIETPICKAQFNVLANKKIAIIPILRAGLGMVDGFMNLLPNAKIGHIGLYRDPENYEARGYYCKLPADIAEREVIILDPMLATGNTALAAAKLLKENGCTHLRQVSLIAAPEGIKALSEAHPDIDIYVGEIDECLNVHCYIVPGLGDAGDRLFGTK
jgi:uracil phosphoribosyltransferase